MLKLGRRTVAAIVLALAVVPPVQSHLLNMTEAQLSVDSQSGQVTLLLHIDLLRTVGSPQAYLSLAQTLPHEAYRQAELWQKLGAAIQLKQANHTIPLKFEAARPPDPFDAAAFEDPFSWPRLWVTFSGEGYRADQTLQATFTAGFIFEEPIALTVDDGTHRMSRWLITHQPSPMFHGSTPAPHPTWTARLQPFANALQAGFVHIFPAGFDHLMFVLAVLLVCGTLRHTAILVTAFTLGHSLSLAVAGFKLVTVPSEIVEPLILVSISIYAWAAWRYTQNHTPAHIWPVAGFGLLHGLGFASAFASLQWADAPLTVLAGFNIGIELAQLLFVAVCWPLLKRFSAQLHKPLAGLLFVTPLLLLGAGLLK